MIFCFDDNYRNAIKIAILCAQGIVVRNTIRQSVMMILHLAVLFSIFAWASGAAYFLVTVSQYLKKKSLKRF